VLAVRKTAIRESLGGSAKVLSSNGFHSRKYIDETGTAVMRLDSGKDKMWVLRFPSVFPRMEEGLFNSNELEWVK
jgi:hypothetical protein